MLQRGFALVRDERGPHACARRRRSPPASSSISSLPTAISRPRRSSRRGAIRKPPTASAARSHQRAPSPKARRRQPGLAVLRGVASDRRHQVERHHALARRRRPTVCCAGVAAPHGSLRRRGREGMNRFEKLLGLKGEAKLRYLDGEFQVLTPGRLRALRRHGRAHRAAGSALLERGAAGGLCQRRDRLRALSLGATRTKK